MKRIIATTALALAVSTAAFADGHMKALNTYQMEKQGDIYASELIGMRIYATESQDYQSWNDETRVKEDAEKEWDDVGEVNDVIMDRKGQVKAVILGIGGFIGIGEKDVAVQMQDIKMVREEGEDEDDFFLVLQSNKQLLTDAEPFKREAQMAKAEDGEAKQETAETKEGEVKAEETAAATDGENKNEETAAADQTQTENAGEMRKDADGRPMLSQPGPIAREGYRDAEPEELTAETLKGISVFGSKDEDIGEVGELILSEDGKQIERVVLDVGGFLGLGEHNVAVTMDELRIIRAKEGDDFRVYVNATQEELEAQPEYKD